ncbi:hypothetical protein [Hoylesella shahii]|uniref:hypothetical protein n=1 Tax=Hoylesella shahii TaxID=228603 RepID=UPI001CB34DBB|nr:hypothetical protein [Hoylesella shahii]MBF1577334.1 hypothetical protein [Hoylesella shahii]
MAMGLLGGMTDYSHQSFQGILEDLKKEKEETLSFSKEILEDVGASKKSHIRIMLFLLIFEALWIMQ